MTAIHMDSKVKQSKTMAILKDSMLTCTGTSAPDVYAHALAIAIGSDSHQFSLSKGESCLIPRGTLTIIIFRENTGNSAWTADFDLVDA
jgi:hypothetical protein